MDTSCMALLIGACATIGCAAEEATEPVEFRPPDQIAFCNAIDDSRTLYAQAAENANRLAGERQMAEARELRRTGMRDALGDDLHFTRWVGFVQRVGARSSDYSPRLRFLVCDDTYLISTNEIPEMHDDDLARLVVDDGVYLDGVFDKPREDSGDYVLELSLTEGGGMDEPELGFALASLERIDELPQPPQY